ncbi:protein FAR1-RELATED SEQUENCE 5-like [Asparagus officinalis]|uniref:protein FAR1-RELATED SEQUENCE 5-like n=1 Tax=Asparagus officinalis TaxID=4686 RepID=UPI00098E678E|nr:protein FAR1-RELATED SEQUENCE 5-like [Asparagus officinalis]
MAEKGIHRRSTDDDACDTPSRYAQGIYNKTTSPKTGRGSALQGADRDAQEEVAGTEKTATAVDSAAASKVNARHLWLELLVSCFGSHAVFVLVFWGAISQSFQEVRRRQIAKPGSRMEEINSMMFNDDSTFECRNASQMQIGEKPCLGMKFNSHVEAYDNYNSYALMMGFGIRKSSVNYSQKDKEVLNRKFVCDKEGYRSNKDKRDIGKNINHRRETRVGCKAMMRIKLMEDKTWKVIGFIEDHTNHMLSSPDKAKMHSITSGREDESVTPQQCIDYMKTQRHNNIGNECLSVIQYFQRKAASDADFYFALEVDCTGQMRSVFWADGKSRATYLKFNDVIVFDVTYKTNKFSLPFAPFTGVNHHRQSTLFGCALLADEQEETFVWLFQEWLNCMHGIEPGAIITDQDRAMCNAIHKVFPNTRHRYCYWHLLRHIADHLHTLNSVYGEEFQKYWDLWCNSGMRSTQRSESINSFFDGYVNSQTQLKEFVTQYETAVIHRRLSKAHEDFRTLNTKPQFHLGHPIERQAGSSYTRTMFHVFQNEIKGCGVLGLQEERKEEKSVLWRVGYLDESNEKWRFVTYDECRELQYSCSCGLFENSGVLCKHILYTLMFNRQCCSLPSAYILHCWTIDARHRNISVSNVVFGKNIAGSVEKINLLKSWALKAKTNNALELAFESDKRMHELDSLLTSFIERVEEEDRGCQAIDDGSSNVLDPDIPQIPTSHTIQHIPQITVRDPEKQARTKGRPRNATRIKSTLEQAQDKKERQKRTCGRCGQLGHYRTSCTVNKLSEIDKED